MLVRLFIPGPMPRTRTMAALSVSASSLVSSASGNLDESEVLFLKRHWRDLIYREAVRMTSALRQALAQSGSRSQINRRFLQDFNQLLVEVRDPAQTVHELDFDVPLQRWLAVFECNEVTGSIVAAGLQSVRAFLHSGLLSSTEMPLSRSLVWSLVDAIAHCRFESTTLETDEVVMASLIELLLEVLRVTIEGVSSETESDELAGESFVFHLVDLLFVLLNQARFSELLRSKAVDAVVEVSTLLFGALKVVDSTLQEDPEPRATKISFPDISAAKREVDSLVEAVASDPKRNSLAGKSTHSEPVHRSKSVVPSAEGPAAASSSSGIARSASTSPSIKPEESTDSAPLPKDFNPFAPENAEQDEMAPDAVEEVMRFRAKLAGVSLDSEEVATPDTRFQKDRISRHCIRELFRFLLASINVVDENAAASEATKKPPGSIRSENVPKPTGASASSTLPSVRTQIAALKCLVAIFTDPLSELAQPLPDELSLFQRELVIVIGDRLLRNLVGLLALDSSSRHLSSLSQLLIVIFSNYRSHFPVQFEYFLTTCFGIIATRPNPVAGAVLSGTGNPGAFNKGIPKPALIALKVTCLEMLAFFLQAPSSIAQIFVMYECSPDFPNTLEALTRCISAGMERSVGSEEVTALSSEILCNFIKTIEASLSRASESSRAKASVKMQDLLELRRVKMIYKEAAKLFNSYPKDAFAMLKEHGLLSPEPAAKEIAAFLRRAQALDKRALGEYLVKPENIEILRAFFSAFKFNEDTAIDMALRQVLESFRLPGEAQQIDRIMGCFAEIYFPASKSGVFASQDACYVLAFSTLMLNTDLHNPNIKRKMTLPEFIRNNRGINDGSDVNEECLARLYHSIKTREIVMPEEHGGEEAFASQWNEVLRRAVLLESTEVGHFSLTPLVGGVVEIVWKPIITSLIPYINQQKPTGEPIADGPLDALRGIASLFEKFGMTEALEALLGNVWSVSNLIPVFSATSGNMIPRYLARLPGFRQVVELMLEVFYRRGNGLQHGWVNFCRMLIMFAESELLSWEQVMFEDMISVAGEVPATASITALMKLAHESRAVKGVERTSILANLGKWFASGRNESADLAKDSASVYSKESASVSTAGSIPSDEMVSIARPFIAEQPILAILTSTVPNLNDAGFDAFMEAFGNYIRWHLVADSGTGSPTASLSGRRPINPPGLNWSASTIVLLIEAFISAGLACGDAERLVGRVWPMALSSLSKLTVSEPAQAPLVICEHAVVGLGRLALRCVAAECDSGPQRGSLVLVEYVKYLCQIGPNVLSHVLEPVMLLVAEALRLRPQIMTGLGSEPGASIWPSLFTLLAFAAKHESAAGFSYELLLMCSPARFPDDFLSEYLDLIGQLAVVSSTSPKLLEMAGRAPVRRVDNAVKGVDLHASLIEAQLLRLDGSTGASSVAVFETWNQLVCGPEAAMARLVGSSVKEVRQAVLGHLHHLLPKVPASISPMQVIPVLFSRVLLPMLMDLRVRVGPMDETVMRAVSLACKTFLWSVEVTTANALGSESAVLSQLWKDLLTALLALLHNGSDQLRESIHESIKNVLLVLASSPNASLSEVWRVSAVLLDGPIPGWRAEIDMRLGLDVAEGPRADDACVETVVVVEAGPEVLVDSNAFVAEDTVVSEDDDSKTSVAAIQDALSAKTDSGDSKHNSSSEALAVMNV